MKKFMAAATAAIAVTLGAPAAQALPLPFVAQENLTSAEGAIADQINQIRVQHGLAPLAWSQYMADISRSWSANCASRATLSHDPMALQLADMENVAVMHNSPYDAVPGWMNSPAHRDNILNPYAKTIGVGIVKNHATGGYYVTMRGTY